MDLTQTQKRILDIFTKSGLVERFYWTGGTLLSHIYLHHRKSLGLDLFAEKLFSYSDLLPFLNDIKKSLNTSIVEEKIHDRWEFTIKSPEETRIEFVYYNHEKKRLSPLKKESGILIDSLKDIAANKLMAYFDRNEPKDLTDIYFLMTKKKFRPSYLLKLVNQKFGSSFSEFMFWSESAKALRILDSVKPLLIGSEQSQKKLLETIRQFFLEGSATFLKKQFDS